MNRQEAVTAVVEKVQLLESERQLKSDLLTFYIEKVVADILDYCHRDDFPDALVYTAVDLIRKRLSDEDSKTAAELQGIRGPLSSVTMDDTEFSFAVNGVDATGCLSDLDFDSIKPKLNLYRKVVSWS